MRTSVDSGPRCYSYIRFSTPEQLKGDSLRRQLELAERYAREKGLVLDDALKMRDLGLSAYKGEHRTKGALGQFLKLIDKGRIPQGSHLIIEELDRLSRQRLLEAIHMLTGILLKGITIHSAADDMTYTPDSYEMGQLVISAYKLSAGYEESRKKSARLKAAWEGKRQKIGEKKLTSRCPAWLKLNRSKTEFIPIPDRVKQIERIFKMSQSGGGTLRIAKTLNEHGGWAPENGWRESYIRKVLHTPAVLGEFQPRTGSGRRPLGEPIRGYYPQIISQELFYSVQRTSERYIGGRNGTINNLFGGLAKCGYCGGPMRFINNGKPLKGGAYLVCDSAVVKKNDCKRHSWRYAEFEHLVLHYCKGLDVGDLLRDEEAAEVSEVDRLLDELAAVNGKLSRLAKRENNLAEQIADAEERELQQVLRAKLSEVINERNTLKEAKKHVERSVTQAGSARQNTTEQIADLKQLMLFMDKETGDKRLDIRERLRSRLRSLIEKIDVYSVGNRPWYRGKRTKDMREMVVHFKTGSYRVLTPTSVQAYEHEEGKTYSFDAEGIDVEVDNDANDCMGRLVQRVMRRAKHKGKVFALSC